MPLLWAGLAILNSARDWRDDLVEGLRRLRTLIVAAAAGYTLLQALAIWLTGSTLLDVAGSTASAALLAALAMAVSWQLLGTAGGGDWLTASEAPAAPASAANAAQAENGSARVVHVHARQAAALDTLLLQQRVYHEPSLTIAALAARMGMPEYKLRRLINQGLWVTAISTASSTATASPRRAASSRIRRMRRRRSWRSRWTWASNRSGPSTGRSRRPSG
ncbi:MAG: hypothetical protein MO853_10105 [Candidatus Protistobacter heckmanni]|nr:hypothetical protein [Candidatus Protistobacter heckmanni]